MNQQLKEFAQKVTDRIKLVSDKDRVGEQGLNQFDWSNEVFYSFNLFRRAHVEVLDKIESNGMWILHCTIFPHFDDDSPIFGLDIVATDKKVSAVFHDFSPTINQNHHLCKWFKEKMKTSFIASNRELPEWGKEIFSTDMLAIRTIKEDETIKWLLDFMFSNLDYYLLNIGASGMEIQDYQNRYCANQKKNPYPVMMLTKFGLTEDKAKQFIDKHLFPESL